MKISCSIIGRVTVYIIFAVDLISLLSWVHAPTPHEKLVFRFLVAIHEILSLLKFQRIQYMYLSTMHIYSLPDYYGG